MITAGVFLAVAVGILVLLQVGTDYARRNRRQVQRRMVREFAPTQGPVANALYKDLGSLDSESGIRPRSAAARPRAASLWERLDALVRQSGLTITVNQLARAAVLGGVCLGAAGGWAAGGVGGVLGGVTGAVTPVLVVSAVRNRRRERLVVQLAAAFDQMARVLRAGQSIIESLRSVVETCDDPLAEEFAPVLHQIDMGLRPDEAFAALGRGTSVLELRLFVLAMAIHRQTGWPP